MRACYDLLKRKRRTHEKAVYELRGDSSKLLLPVNEVHAEGHFLSQICNETPCQVVTYTGDTQC